MFDSVIQLAILIIGVPAVLAVGIREGRFINPVSILFVSFFVPLFFCLFRFSALQSTSWEYRTYVAMISSIGAWIIFPTILLLMFKVKAPAMNEHSLDVVRSKAFGVWCRLFALLVISCYIVGNYIQAKNVLPALNPQAAFAIHAEFPFGLRFFARATPAAVMLLYLAFWGRRKKLDMVLLVIAALTPLTRLSRIDPAMTFVGLAAIASILPIISISRKKLFLLCVLLVALMIGTVELGNLRHNRFGMYEFKYSEMIGWRPQIVGPAEIWPVLYGYTSLSFENFNQVVVDFIGRHTIVLFSFDWLFSGFIKLNWFTQYNLAQAMTLQYSIISNAAAVPTALVPFFADGGAVGMALPMMFYAAIWIMFYAKAHSSFLALALYGIYSGAFALSSFQALIASGPIAQQLLWAVLIFAISSRQMAPRKSRQINSAHAYSS